jgi:hypothetical protein
MGKLFRFLIETLKKKYWASSKVQYGCNFSQVSMSLHQANNP